MGHKYYLQRAKGNLEEDWEWNQRNITIETRCNATGITQFILQLRACSMREFRNCVVCMETTFISLYALRSHCRWIIWHNTIDAIELNQALAKQIIIVQIKLDTSRRSITLDVIACDFAAPPSSALYVWILISVISQDDYKIGSHLR